MVAELTTVVAISTSVILGWAGLSKVVAFEGVSSSLAQLELPLPARPTHLAVGLIALEICVPTMAVAGVAAVSAIVTLLLGVSFAAAGGWATRRRLQVSCHCFGASSGKHLGWRQLATLPIWMIAAYALATTNYGSYGSRIEIAAAIAVSAALLQAVVCARLFRRARLDRRAYLGA